MKCTNKKIGKRVWDYAIQEFGRDEELENHLFECSYCWETFKKIKKEQEEVKPAGDIIKTYLTKNSLEQIFRRIEKGRTESVKKRYSFPPGEPTFELLKDGVEITKIELSEPSFSYSQKLTAPGRYSINYHGKPTGSEREVPVGIGGVLYSRTPGKMEKIRIPNPKETKKKIDVIVSFEETIDGIILSLKIK